MTEQEDPLASWVRERSPGGIVDCYVNANPRDITQHYNRTQYLFQGSRSMTVTADPAELVERMDRYQITRALLSPPRRADDIPDAEGGERWTLDAVQRYPERFRLAVRVDPWQGMEAVRALERMVRNDGAAALRMNPMHIGKPLSHKIYYPLYAKCIELDIPVTSTCGIPGPRIPGMLQHPKHFDEVCYFWPELKIVSAHGGEPWTGLLVKLLTKWPNLYHMISAFAPRYYPKDTIRFLNSSRGRRKVMFATDYPLMSWERAVPELQEVDIKQDSWPYFLYHNAAAVFWNEHRPNEEPLAVPPKTEAVPALAMKRRGGATAF